MDHDTSWCPLRRLLHPKVRHGCSIERSVCSGASRRSAPGSGRAMVAGGHLVARRMVRSGVHVYVLIAALGATGGERRGCDRWDGTGLGRRPHRHPRTRRCRRTGHGPDADHQPFGGPYRGPDGRLASRLILLCADLLPRRDSACCRSPDGAASPRHRENSAGAGERGLIRVGKRRSQPEVARLGRRRTRDRPPVATVVDCCRRRSVRSDESRGKGGRSRHASRGGRQPRSGRTHHRLPRSRRHSRRSPGPGNLPSPTRSTGGARDGVASTIRNATLSRPPDSPAIISPKPR